MQHPIITAAADIDTALKAVADTNPTFMTTDDKATALREPTRLEGRLAELRLRVLADAADVAEQTGARDTASWLTHHTRVRFEDARTDQALARSLERRFSALGTALRDGDVNLAQAQVIVRALDALPGDLPRKLCADAETALIGYAADFGPRPLARLGRRILDVIAPDIAEAAEARSLADLEADAQRNTRLTLRRLGDGTTRLHGILPDATATRLLTYLEAFTNPRKHDPDSMRLPYPRLLGEACCQLLEVVDPTRLPQHAGDATTLIVTIPLETLRSELGVAGILGGSVPGDELTGDTITANEARRLACTAGILPAVLGGKSEVLDLGRTRRLFSPAQHKALRLRHTTCQADGCDIPATWTEAHHLQPWSHGGLTDLVNAILLCRHHHQRIHDTGHYGYQQLPNGNIRFHRRT
ncbi:putative HNH endonuclease [metagenome]|uniref:Putative HNH endonuclease n=1 Tax=metagenome TaxID=256318 RepID=A0A2P2C3H6_9ZZZZ